MNTAIKSTTDYSSFKEVSGNRTISKAHVKKLKQAIQAKPQLTQYNPILVNENMEIIDGQHRKEATEELNLPVYYIQVEGLTLDDVQALNSGKKNWSPIDYAKSFAMNGSRDYQLYLDHKNEFKFNHDITMQYAGFPETNNNNISFIHGNFSAGKDLELVLKYSEQLRQLKQFLPHAYVRSTALALLSMFQNPDYDHLHMMKRMEEKGILVQRYTRKEESIRELASYYNFHKKSGKGYVLFDLK
jgi:hypothetical protein